MNMYILFKMFVLCYFCNIDMYIFDKINVLYLLTSYVSHSFNKQMYNKTSYTASQVTFGTIYVLAYR